MTKIINLYAGPGAGKSTTAAKVFALLKERGDSVELVNEYVKQWAWEKRKPVDYDQFYFFAKQSRKEYSLFGEVDLVVTDAPVLLTCYYAQVYGSPEQAVLFRSMLLTYLRMCEDKGHEHKHVFLQRTKAYDPRGRFQDEAGARQIDEDLRRYIKEVGIRPIEILGDEHCAQKVFEHAIGSEVAMSAADQNKDDVEETCAVCGRRDVRGFMCWRVGHLSAPVAVIGYENPDGDPSKVAPVSSLTSDETTIKVRVEALTAAIEEGERAQRQIGTIQRGCPHRVFNDSEGVPYGFRKCVICGRYMGPI